MRIELNLTRTHLAIAIVFLCAGATVGYAANGQSKTTDESPIQPLCPAEMKLAEEDFNALASISLIGHCEKLGLAPSIFVQDFNGTPFGVLVCVEAA